MKKIMSILAALAIIGNAVSPVRAIPEKYTHDVMVAVSENTLETEDGNLYEMAEIDHLYVGSHYEVCVDTFCTDDRTDDEIVDFCPLDECSVTLKAFALQGGSGELVIVTDGEWSGHIYKVDAALVEYEPYFVTLNTHWSGDVTDDSVLKVTDLETWELMNWEE